MPENVVRCPQCHDLFMSQDGLLPHHVLDVYEGAVVCEGSQVAS